MEDICDSRLCNYEFYFFGEDREDNLDEATPKGQSEEEGAETQWKCKRNIQRAGQWKYCAMEREAWQVGREMEMSCCD